MLGHCSQSVGGALPGARGALSTRMNVAVTMPPRGTGALTFDVPPSDPGDVLIAFIGSITAGQDFSRPSSAWYIPFSGAADGSHFIAVKRYEAGDPTSFTFSKAAGNASAGGVLARLKAPASFTLGGPRSVSPLPFDLEATDVLVVGVTNGAEYTGGEALISNTGTPNVFAKIFREVAGNAESPNGTSPIGPNAGLRSALRMRSN